MLRRSMLLAVASLLPCAAQLKRRDQAPPPGYEGIVDEDEDLLPETEYAFNPIQAKKDLKVGNYYAKKGNHRAAAGRYVEATRWNPQYGEAYFKLGRAREKLEQTPEALAAYRAFLKIEPNGKQSREARRRLGELEKQLVSLPLTAEEAEAKK